MPSTNTTACVKVPKEKVVSKEAGIHGFLTKNILYKYNLPFSFCHPSSKLHVVALGFPDSHVTKTTTSLQTLAYPLRCDSAHMHGCGIMSVYIGLAAVGVVGTATGACKNSLQISTCLRIWNSIWPAVVVMHIHVIVF